MGFDINIKVTGCENCPYLKEGVRYTIDGKESSTLYYCEKKAFGRNSVDAWGAGGLALPPTDTHPRCPIVKNDNLIRLSKKYGIEYDTLIRLFSEDGRSIQRFLENYFTDSIFYDFDSYLKMKERMGRK